MKKLEWPEFRELLSKGGLIVDTRQPEVFADGFIEGSVSIAYNEEFIATFQNVIDEEQPVLIITDEGNMEALASAIGTSGVTNVAGYLNGGMETYKAANTNNIDMLVLIEADEFAMDYQYDEFYLVDVRSKEAFDKEHVEDAEHIALDDLQQYLTELDVAGNYYVYGNTVADAVTAGSVFKKNGFQRIRPIMAAYETIRESKVPRFVQKKKPGSPPNATDN